MAWQSTLPAAIDGLVAVLQSDSELSGIVRDGPELRDMADQEAVFVGHTGTDEDTAADGSVAREGLAVQPNRESYSIRCGVSVLNGASDIGAARTRAYELFPVVGAAIAADKTLGGVVMAASVGEWTLSLSQTDVGAWAVLTFNVDVDAFTSL